MSELERLRFEQAEYLRRYRMRSDASPAVVQKLEKQLEILGRCVDLNDSRVDNQLLITLRNTMYKAMHFAPADDALIVGMRLTDRPVIRNVAIADLIWSGRLNDHQQRLYDLLNLHNVDLATHNFHYIIDGLDNCKV